MPVSGWLAMNNCSPHTGASARPLMPAVVSKRQSPICNGSFAQSCRQPRLRIAIDWWFSIGSSNKVLSYMRLFSFSARDDFGA